MKLEVLELGNSPKEFEGKDAILNKNTNEYYINKDIIDRFFNQFVNPKDLPKLQMFDKQIMFEFADWYCNGVSNSERRSPEKMFPKYLKLKK